MYHSQINPRQISALWFLADIGVSGIRCDTDFVICYSLSIKKKKMFKILTSVQEKKLYPYAHLLVDETYQCLHNVTLLFL